MNCFQISIFVPLRTAKLKRDLLCPKLWIAFKLVSLFHYEQLYRIIQYISNVVNCFQISIFVPLRTAQIPFEKSLRPLWIAFKLVSLFHYEQLAMEKERRWIKLWIAFKLVSLFHYEQHIITKSYIFCSCELLSN